MAGAVVGSVISGAFASRNARRSEQAAAEARRRRGSTGRSAFDTDTGQITIDPSIRDQTLNQRLSLRSLQPQITGATGRFLGGIAGIRESLGGLAGEFEGNRSAFREAALNPAREQIARAEGETARGLARRRIFGSFGEQARASVAATGATALADASARVEQERISTLSQFLGMDAELLQAGLTSEMGRIDALTGVEQILAGLTQDEFNREITALQLASGQGEGSRALDSAAASSAGVAAQAGAQAIGGIFEAVAASGGAGGGVTTPVPGASFSFVNNDRGFVGGF